MEQQLNKMLEQLPETDTDDKILSKHLVNMIKTQKKGERVIICLIL